MAFVTPVVEHWLEREIAQWVHPMKDRPDDPSHHEWTCGTQSGIHFPFSLVEVRLVTAHRLSNLVLLVTSDISANLGNFRFSVQSRMFSYAKGSSLSFQPVLHNRSNKGHGMCYSVCEMVHIKYPLLLIGKSSPWSSPSSQYSTIGLTKAMVCIIPPVRWCI